MKIPDFSKLVLDLNINRSNVPGKNVLTSYTGIRLRSRYEASDIRSTDHRKNIAGAFPFLRGAYPAMYLQKKWNISQYPMFSSIEECNKYFKKNIINGNFDVNLSFDQPTLRGYDSDNPAIGTDVGVSGIPVDTAEDMKDLFDGIPMDKVNISMVMNGAVLPVLAFFIVAAEDQRIALINLKGTIQNDILKEFIVRNAYIYPPEMSMRITTDVFHFLIKKMPGFNINNLSGYLMHEAGAPADMELAYTFADAIEYIRAGLNAGLNIDDLASRFTFSWGAGMSFYMEIAKIRAARVLWAEIVKNFNPYDSRSCMLRTHCQTSGISMQKQNSLNNIARMTMQALAAVLGGVQSIHTSVFEQSVAEDNENTEDIAVKAQKILRDDSDISKSADPLGGSYMIESLTEQLTEKVRAKIREIESHGGMLKAIEIGLPKMRLEIISAKKQARIDAGKRFIIGVNKFREQSEGETKTYSFDNTPVLERQKEKIQTAKARRDEKKLVYILESIHQAAQNNTGNLLELSVEAARAGATVGEISQAIEKVSGRHIIQHKTISGIYSMEVKKDETFAAAKELTASYTQMKGSKPSIMITKLGLDGHDRGAKLVATAFSDLGFEVIFSPGFQSPAAIAKSALEHKADILGISSLSSTHKALIPLVAEELRICGARDMMIIVGGIIPKNEHVELKRAGVSAIFGPDTIVSQAAIEILNLLIYSNDQ